MYTIIYKSVVLSYIICINITSFSLELGVKSLCSPCYYIVGLNLKQLMFESRLGLDVLPLCHEGLLL